jgi:amino acid adenylation domain-containing protein
MKSNVVQDILNENFFKLGSKIAIEYDDRQITYSELNRRSYEIAQWIFKHNILKDSCIGIMASNKIKYISAIIGILRAGCIFAPLDLSNPYERIEQLIKAVDLSYVFIDKGNKDFLEKYTQDNKEERTHLIDLDDIHNDRTTICEPLPIRYLPEDKIYIYFTSGTSGKPKAIIGKNKSLLQYCNCEIKGFKITPGYRISQFATTSDAFLKEIFVSFLSGGTLCIPRDFRKILYFEDLKNWIEKLRINMVHCVPHIFRILSSNKLNPDYFKHLKYMVLSGERIFPADLKNWYDKLDEKVQIINLYGTTETTILNTQYFVQKSDVDRKRIPIGKPMEGNRLIILDEGMRICNIGKTGEIFIRTPYRTFGYCNDPELTVEKFVPNPFSKDPNDIIYRTGDLGRFLSDGQIELIGRKDRQVKIRGHRIELEEIEHNLSELPFIKECVVVKKEISENVELLISYIELKEINRENNDFYKKMIDEFLKERLPDYMIPTHTVIMESIPKTPNRKINYQLLPDPLEINRELHIPPKNDIENKLARMWSEILSLDKEIGVYDNFFKLGGNSLNIMSLTNEIQKSFNIELSIGDIFENQTLQQMSKLLIKRGIHNVRPLVPMEKKDFYPLSYNQKRLWISFKLNPTECSYNIIERIILYNDIDIPKLKSSLTKIINRHPSFSTYFIEINDSPVQRILDEIDVSLKVIDISTLNEKEKELEREKIYFSEISKPFDLKSAPLFRTFLIKLNKKRYDLIINIHHIIFDGWSHRVLVNEFIKQYESDIGTDGDKFPPLKLRYIDFADWQNRTFALMVNHKPAFQFWQNKLEGSTKLQLPYDLYPRENKNDGAGYKVFIQKNVKDNLKNIAQKENTTLFNILLAIGNILLSQLSGQNDIITGFPAFGRAHADLQNVVGFFVNTLVMRVRIDLDLTFYDFLQSVSRDMRDSLTYQDVPLELICDILKMRFPTINIFFNMFGTRSEKELEELKNFEESGIERVRDIIFDIMVYLKEYSNGIKIESHYNKHLFKQDTIAYILREYNKLTEWVAYNPSAALKEYYTAQKKRIFSKNVSDLRELYNYDCQDI